MEELSWFNHHQQEIEENIMFDSEYIFFNPIQDLPKPGSTVYSNPVAAPTGRQIGCHRQLSPTMLDSIHVASSFGSASQYWRQTLAVNGGKNVIPLTTTTATDAAAALESPLSATNSYGYTDYNNLCSKIIKNQSIVVSSDNSVTEQTDDVIDSSQCSSEKKPNYNSGFYNDSLPKSKRSRSDPVPSNSSDINFRQTTDSDETDSEVVAQMKEVIYREAAFRPVRFSDEEVVERPTRKNVRISSDPQTVAARRRREKISERIRVLQKLVPGGNKMDTASMLDEAANYLKFLRSQVKAFEQFGHNVSCGTTTNAHSTTQNSFHNVTVGIPFPMQTPFLLPYSQSYPTPPPA